MGSKEKSKGLAEDEGLMYPAVARAGWSPDAKESRIMLCDAFLLIFWQLKVWSPKQSCFVLHLQVGQLLISKMGNRNFRHRVIWKAQIGSLCCALLHVIPTSGYDVCGDRMLGSRWMSSVFSMTIIV